MGFKKAAMKGKPMADDKPPMMDHEPDMEDNNESPMMAGKKKRSGFSLMIHIGKGKHGE